MRAWSGFYRPRIGRAMPATRTRDDRIGRAASGAIAAAGAVLPRPDVAGTAAAAVPGLDHIFLPGATRADVLAQPCERGVLARALWRSLHLSAVHQGHDHHGEDRGHHHRLRASPGLSPRLRAHHQQRQGARTDPGIHFDSLLGRHHCAKLLLADPAGRQRHGEQGAHGAGHRRRAAANALQSVQRAAGDGPDPAAADDSHLVWRHVADRSHTHHGRQNPWRERMARLPHRLLPAEPAGRVRRGPAGFRAGAGLLRHTGAARESARNHDRADDHGRSEPASRLAAGQRRGRSPSHHHHVDRRDLQPLLQPRPVVGRLRQMTTTAGRLGLSAAVLAVLIYLIFPVIVVVAISFSSGNFLVFPPPGFSLRWYESIAGDPEWVNALWVTLKVGSLSALIAVLLGVPAAFALVRHVIPAKALLSALILCALVTPPIVTALSTYLFFVPRGLVNTVGALACAHAVSGIPFVVINPPGSLRSADINLERAAVIHGAHPLWAVLRITLPIISPGIVIGAIFAFVHSAHELLVATFVLGGVGKPVAVKIWSGVQATSDPTIAAASAILIGLAIFTFASAAATQSLAKRRMA